MEVSVLFRAKEHAQVATTLMGHNALKKFLRLAHMVIPCKEIIVYPQGQSLALQGSLIMEINAPDKELNLALKDIHSTELHVSKLAL